MQSGQSGSCQSHRQLLADRGALTPLRHVPAAIPLRLENQYFSLDVPPSGDGNAAERHLYVLRPGMLGEPELELCGTTNVNEPKRGNAASID